MAAPTTGAERVLEQAGKPFIELVGGEILGPLGMRVTAVTYAWLMRQPQVAE